MTKRSAKRRRLEPTAAKVPEVALIFWVLKLLTTGMGEAMSDFLGQNSVPLAGAVGVFGILIAFRLQMNKRIYQAPYYWFLVMMVAIFGTMVADAIHDGTGLAYPITTVMFSLFVAAIFTLWYRSEKTLSIHTITTRRREGYYWAAVLGTFALGTAAGDMTAASLHLGYFDSILVFAALMFIPLAGWWTRRMDPILAFWFAYVLTRPLGASFADWFGKPRSISGLGLGDGFVSGVALVVFIALVAYVAIKKNDIQPAPDPRLHHLHVPHPHLPHPHRHDADVSELPEGRGVDLVGTDG